MACLGFILYVLMTHGGIPLKLNFLYAEFAGATEGRIKGSCLNINILPFPAFLNVLFC